MAITGGPDINEQGLLLYLDAANKISYSGSGLIKWNSLVNNISASFGVTSTTSSQFLGSLVFNGTTQFADFNLPSSGSTLTVEMWANLTPAAQIPKVPYYNKMLFGWNLYDAIITAQGLGFNTSANDIYGISSASLSSLGVVDNWRHYVFEMRSDVSYTNNKIWIDGIQQTLTQQIGVESSVNRTFNSGQGRVSGWKYDTGYRMPMSCSVFKVYNRSLTQSEILQNYNALRSRYPAPTPVSQQIVLNGLVLNLDAGNLQSYPGSGTAWNDIGGLYNNITLTNGPTYSSDNQGSIVFDGSNDYADFFAANLTTTTTVEIWAKLGTPHIDKMMFGWGVYDVYMWNNLGFGYNTGNSDLHGIPFATFTNLGLVGNWKHYVFEMRSDVSYINNKMYINGVSQTLSQLTGTEFTGGRTFNSGQGRISGWRNDTGYPIAMNCGVFRVYNRALTTQEIDQNYNALRTRYGL